MLENQKELKTSFENRLNSSELSKIFNVKLGNFDLDYAELIIEHSSLISNPTGKGTINGGILAMLSDSATAYALATNFNGQMSFATIDLQIHYLARAKSTVTAKAKVIRKGKRINVAEVEIFDIENTMVSKSIVTFILTKPMEFTHGIKKEK
ncbi:MAG: PaaI family thioesterase [Calditrichaeota bacterium]|nr:MAG: PaaI family thioesterase [Calditrichota bacterium]